MLLSLIEVPAIYRHWDLKVAQALNKCGVIAVVQLLRTMPTRSKAKEMLNLLQRVKDLAFGFMQEMMTVGEDSDKVSLDEAPSGNGQRNAKQLIDEFARSQLQEIFRCFMEWMDRNFAMPLRTVDLIVEELKESTALCTERYFDNCALIAMFRFGTKFCSQTNCLALSSNNGRT